MPINLPPNLQQNIKQQAAKHLPVVKDYGMQLYELLYPLFKEARVELLAFGKKLAAAGPGATLGNTFRHIGFVGLNRVELLLGGEVQSMFGESWQDLVSDSVKRHLGLCFFAPRGLDGRPVNPYVFLLGEGTHDDQDAIDPALVALGEQTVGSTALLDLCRMGKAAPNTLNILLVADTLFHWDMKDNYVLPTTPTGWVRDVEQIIRTYPRTTKVNIYTQWETDILTPSERTTVHRLRDMPLDPDTWLNQPTFQEKYGSHMLFASIAIALLTYAGLFYQQSRVADVSEKLHMVEQQIPRGGQFSDLERVITEQEKMYQKRDLFALVTRDVARATQRAGMQVNSIEVRVTDPENPPVNYLVTIEAKPGVYQGWLQEEPIARAVMLNSALLDAVRKPPTTGVYKLEGLVNAADLAREYKIYVPRAAAPVSPAVAGVAPSAGPLSNAASQEAGE